MQLLLSVVVVAYDIARELPRTLYTLSAQYQRDMAASDFEVIVVDNGSPTPVDPRVLETLSSWPGQFRLIRIHPASPSPAAALNQGIAQAKGQCIGAMIDGARMSSPGLLSQVLSAHRALPDAVVATLGWYLGYDYQRQSMACGYDQAREDALLASIDWKSDGYRLFAVSTMDESSVDGWHRGFSESNAIFMSRERWRETGGFDERFDLPGGGLVNLDLCKRVLEAPGSQCVLLLGEATFHQIHGGTATNTPAEKAHADWLRWSGQYEAIRGQAYRNPTPARPLLYWGGMPQAMKPHYLRGLAHPPGGDGPAGLGTDARPGRWAMPDSLWPDEGMSPPQQYVHRLFVQALEAGRYAFVAHACRLLCRYLPPWPGVLHLLSLVGAWSPYGRDLPGEDLAPLQEFEAWLQAASGDGATVIPDTLPAFSEAQREHRTLRIKHGEQQARIAALETEVGVWRSELEAQQAANSQLRQVLEQTDATLQGVLSSHSWKLTAGLRRMGDMVRDCARYLRKP